MVSKYWSLLVHHRTNHGHFHRIRIVDGRGNGLLHPIGNASLHNKWNRTLHGHRADLLHRYLDLLQLWHRHCLHHGHPDGNGLWNCRDHGTRHAQRHILSVGHVMLLIMRDGHILGHLDVLGQGQTSQRLATGRGVMHTRGDGGKELKEPLTLTLPLTLPLLLVLSGRSAI